MLRERGFYVIKDQFFVDFPDPYLKGNKGEHRPHYFALRDPKTNLIWMIPMSSRAEKFKAIMDKKLASGRPCDTLHICRLDNGIMNAFLLQDMFPITEDYILQNIQSMVITSYLPVTVRRKSFCKKPIVL